MYHPGSILRTVIVGSLLLACLACGQVDSDTTDADDTTLENLLPGTWEAVSIYVDVQSAMNADTSFVFRINDGDWSNIFQVLPPRTYFERDNKYRTEYRDLRDSVMSIDRGMWNVFGDTLMMIEPEVTYQYLVTQKSGLIELSGFRDWDNDGQEDDTYREVKRRVSIGTTK